MRKSIIILTTLTLIMGMVVASSCVLAKKDGEEIIKKSDALLVAVGRVANYQSLDLDEAAISYTKRGIDVDDRCKTNKGHIYAAGDVTNSDWKQGVIGSAEGSAAAYSAFEHINKNFE